MQSRTERPRKSAEQAKIEKCFKKRLNNKKWSTNQNAEMNQHEQFTLVDQRDRAQHTAGEHARSTDDQ